uniref:Uncharacterized protein n=1 Tax=viral metagenome TaxID=1070528 RepID=A0A6H1ZI08_9ZZZZ
MAVNPVIENIEKKTRVTLNGTVSRGDLIAWNATGYVLADASDAVTNLYARYVALDDGVTGGVINACKGCTIYDGDAPFSGTSSTLFLSATATVTNTITETRPTTAADVIQIVGENVDTYRRRIDIKPPQELEVFIQPAVYDTTTEPGLGVVDSPVWVGPALDTAGEDAYFTGRFPSNVISVNEAYIVYNSIGESTGTVSAALIACADGATNTGDTGTAHTAAVPTSIADNKLCYSDVSAMFDADALKANYNFTVTVAQVASAAGDLQVLGLYIRYIVV